MRWAITIELVPEGTSCDVGDYLSLPGDTFIVVSGNPGFSSMVGEYKGLRDAIEIILEEG